jgi:hypothetical protein
MKELAEISDKDLILKLIQERKSGCTNIHAPLYRRLTTLERRLTEADVLKEKGNDRIYI